MSDEQPREIIKRISDAALELAFIRHSLESDEFDETDYDDVGGARQREQAREQWWEEIKEDTLNCLTGDDTGCLDPEELDESNCELLWLQAAFSTIRQEERRAAFKEALTTIEQAAKDCPVFVFHSRQGREFLIAALEAKAAEAEER